MIAKQEYLTNGLIEELLQCLIKENPECTRYKALATLQRSNLYAKLQQKETGLYLEGIAYLYELYQAEVASV